MLFRHQMNGDSEEGLLNIIWAALDCSFGGRL